MGAAHFVLLGDAPRRSVFRIFERDAAMQQRVAKAIGRRPIFICASLLSLVDHFRNGVLCRRTVQRNLMLGLIEHRAQALEEIRGQLALGFFEPRIARRYAQDAYANSLALSPRYESRSESATAVFMSSLSAASMRCINGPRDA